VAYLLAASQRRLGQFDQLVVQRALKAVVLLMDGVGAQKVRWLLRRRQQPGQIDAAGLPVIDRRASIKR